MVCETNCVNCQDNVFLSWQRARLQGTGMRKAPQDTPQHQQQQQGAAPPLALAQPCTTAQPPAQGAVCGVSHPAARAGCSGTGNARSRQQHEQDSSSRSGAGWRDPGAAVADSPQGEAREELGQAGAGALGQGSRAGPMLETSPRSPQSTWQVFRPRTPSRPSAGSWWTAWRVGQRHTPRQSTVASNLTTL